MAKSILISFITLLLFSTNLFAEKKLTTEDECVYLDELTAPHIPHKEVFCGLNHGESKLFSKEYIESRLYKEGLNGKVLEDVRVTRSGEAVTENYIKEKILDEFKAVYPDYDFKIETFRMPNNMYAENLTDFKVSITTDKFGSTNAIVSNGKRNSAVYIFIRARAEGYVSQHKIMQGKDIAGKVKLESIDVTTLRGRLVTDIDNLVAARTIPSGKPIVADITKQKPSGLKGDEVRIVIKTGRMSLEAIGVLEENAYIGKTVAVKNKDSNNIISAKYVDVGVVEVTR